MTAQEINASGAKYWKSTEVKQDFGTSPSSCSSPKE